MVTIYFHSLRTDAVKKLDTFKSGAWIHVEAPHADELEDLAKTHNLDLGHLKDALDPFEVPRYDVEDGNVYLFTRLPVREGDAVQTVPLLIVFMEKGIVTVTNKRVSDFIGSVQHAAHFTTTQKSKLLLQLCSRINHRYTLELHGLTRGIFSMRRQLQLEDIRNRDIARLVVMEDTLQGFLSALVPTQLVLSRLLLGKHIPFFEEDKELIEDLQLNTQQLVELCRSGAKSIVTIRESYSTIMTNNLNRVIKALTSLTVILMVPNLVFSFYGMNIGLPGASLPSVAPLLTGVVAGVMLLLVALFIKMKWL